MEEWRSIVGYENLYEISNKARVRSLHTQARGTIMSVFMRNGYPSTVLSKNGQSKHYHVHRLMAEAFLPNRQNKPFAIFIDGNRENLSLANIRWATAQELVQYSQSAKNWKDVISIIRKNYSPDLLRELNQNFNIIQV